MSARPPVERELQLTFIGGLMLSAPLLLVGLALASERLLLAGIVILAFTPVVGAVVLTLELLAARDWPFAAVSVFILLVLASSLVAAARLSDARRTEEPRPALPIGAR